MISLIDSRIYEEMINERDYEKKKSNILNLLDPSNILNLFKKIPRTFEISTNNGSCYFNTQVIIELSFTILEFLSENPEANKYNLDIEDNKCLKKIEEICQGNIVIFDKKELINCQNIVNALEIQNCPDYMRMEDYEKHIKKGVAICPNCELFFLDRIPRTFIISTHQHNYECNLFGICSSKVLHDFITANPDSEKYVYDYSDEYNEFQQICDFFNFNKISITTDNLDFLKEISEDLQIDIISSRIKHIGQDQEKMIEKIEENQKTVDKINQLFEWLYKINDLSVKTVKNLIIESKWSKTEERVQEMVAFILQAIKTDDLLHSNLIELLIQLDSANSNELRILLPFLKDKLLKTFDQERYNCEFVYRLYKEGLITKEELFPKLKEFETKNYQNSKNLLYWFLPEIIELGCFDEQKYCKNWDSSIFSHYYPDKIDLYKKMRDSFEPDDEITRALRIDDVDTFQSIISSKNIKNISVCFVPPNIFDSFNANKISYLNYSAALGSIKCFKYLLLNHSKIDSQTFYFALQGGNIEIIKIADNQNQYQNKNVNKQSRWGSCYKTDKTQMLKILIQKQRNDLFDWVFEQKITNYDVIGESLRDIISCSVSNGNVHALVSIIDKGFNICDLHEYRSLQSIAASTGFYHLLKFLNRIGCRNTCDGNSYYGNNNSHYVTYGNLKIFKYCIKTSPNEALIYDALKTAIVLDNAKMYNYFFDQHSDKITSSIISMTLSKSLEKKTNDLFYSLIEKFKKVCPLVFDKYNWNTSLLEIACRYGKIEPFYFIIILIDKAKIPSFTNCIFEAASSNLLEICKYLVDNKYNINYVDLFKKLSKVSNVSSEIISFLFNSSGLEFDKSLFLPLLSPAIRNSNVNFVEFLVERGIFYDECLIDAVSVKSLEIVNIILKYNSKPTFINRGSEDGTALHVAINKDSLEILQRLLAIPSINPYLYDKNNHTPLMLAVNQMRFPMIKEIISFSGKNIVYHRESIDVLLRMLLKDPSSNKSNYNYNGNHNWGRAWSSSAWGSSAWSGYNKNNNTKTSNSIMDTRKILEILQNIPNIEIVLDEKNQMYFPEICSRQNIDIKIVQFFLKIDKINVNCVSVVSGETALTSAVKAQRTDIVQSLINDPRINCNLANTNCETPLNLAVQKNNLEIVKLLLSVPSINPYLYDKNNTTSLIIAANQMNLPIINEIISFSGKDIIYHRESVDFLLEALINSISINNDNNRNNNKYGFNINNNNYAFNRNNNQNNNKTNKNYTNEDVITTLQNLLSIDNIQMIFDEKNQILFLNICSNKNIDIKLVQIFLNFDDFDINIFSPKNGNTPLISALKEERVDIAELLINDPRTNINMTNYVYESALIIASQKQYVEIVKLLVNNPRFDPIESRADYAFTISNDEIFDILLSLNLFDVNCVIINPKRSRNGNSWGYNWDDSSTLFRSEETALTQAAKRSNLAGFEHIIKHPTFDKNKSKLSKSIHLLMSSIKKENVRNFLNILKDNNLINEFFNDTESFQQLLSLNCIEILKEIFEGKYGPFVVSAELLRTLFMFSLKINKYSLDSLTYLINYDKEHNNVIDLKNESFLMNIEKTERYPLMSHIKQKKVTEDVVKLLVENGCDVNKQNKLSIFPLEYAIYNNDYILVHALLETHKIDFNQKILNKKERFLMDKRDDDQNINAICERERFLMDKRDDDQNAKASYETYLHLAAGSKNSKILKSFLELNVFDVNVKNSNDETPLMVACYHLLDKNIQILFTKDDLDFHCRNNENEDALQIVQKVGNKNEFDIFDKSNDSLTKEQYLSNLISVITQKKLQYGNAYDDDDNNDDDGDDDDNNDDDGDDVLNASF